jgi:hypothetical protein
VMVSRMMSVSLVIVVSSVARNASTK